MGRSKGRIELHERNCDESRDGDLERIGGITTSFAVSPGFARRDMRKIAREMEATHVFNLKYSRWGIFHYTAQGDAYRPKKETDRLKVVERYGSTKGTGST